jgi:ankyrin repeat protein
MHIDNTGRTALMYAAHGGGEDAAKSLLEKGADTTLKDKDGKTAWAYAAGAQHR